MLLALTAEWGRVLAPHGSICVELGDTYAGSGGAGGDYGDSGWREGQLTYKQYQQVAPSDGRGPRLRDRRHNAVTGNKNRDKRPGWPLDKSLCGIPDAYALSLEYGWNVLRRDAPDSPAGRWRVRNKVAWVRPNPPVGALGDKWRPATSYLTVACRARDRYFDLDATRTYGASADRPVGHTNGSKGRDRNDVSKWDTKLQHHPAGAPPLDWWNIPPAGTKTAHYAVFPEALCVRPILAMSPRRVCTVCGKPSRRITAAFTLDSYRASTRPQTIKAVALADAHGLTDDHIAAVRAFGTSDAGKAPTLNNGAGKNTEQVKALAAEAKAVLGGYFREFVQSTTAERTSTWTTCGCPGADGLRLDGYHTGTGWRPGHVLDPFAGTGTTGAVAVGHGRDCTLIDLDARNAELARDRLGMFLTVDPGIRQAAG